MSDPIVSVVLPTYNRASTLPRSISTVLNQTYTDLELIVVDDGSTDETSQVVVSLADARTRFMRHKVNQGPSAARNTGIVASRGRYIAFQDSDDEWLPDKLDQLITVLESAPPAVGVAYSSFYRLEGNRKRLFPPRAVQMASRLPSRVHRLEGDIHRSLHRGNFVTPQAAMVRRDCFERVGLFDEEMFAFVDWELWLRLSKAYHFAFVSAPLVLVYATPASVSSDPDWVLRAFRSLLEKHAHGPGQSDLVAHYLYRCGDLQCRAGNPGQGRGLLFRAATTSSLNSLYWLAAFVSLLGSRIYSRAFRGPYQLTGRRDMTREHSRW